MRALIPTAEPFFFPGGAVGCLLIHGFTGSPKEMREMGEYLAGQGHTVLGVRLPGHATQPEDLSRVRWQDWWATVEDGWHILDGALRRQGAQPPHIFTIGLSMGGALSLLAGCRLPVAGVVAMSTPFDLPDDPRLPYIGLLHWLFPSVPKGQPDWRNLQAAADHVDYPTYPTKAIIELRDLLAEMRRSLPQVQAPVLLIHSKDDANVQPQNMPAIEAALGARDKTSLWIEDCGHVITCEPQRERIFAAAAAFIERVAGQNKHSFAGQEGPGSSDRNAG